MSLPTTDEGRHGPLMARYLNLLAGIDRLSWLMIVISMTAMVTIVSVQVFMRYVLSSSIDSAAELSRLLFVWTIFLALPQGIPRGVHVGIDALTSIMPKPLRALIFRLTTLISCILMGALCWLALVAVGDKWEELMPTLDVTSALYYIPVLICAIHALLHLLAQLITGEVDSTAATVDAREEIA